MTQYYTEHEITENRVILANELCKGTRKQGRSVLINAEDPDNLAYCCLGVAAEVFSRSINLKKEVDTEVRGYPCYLFQDAVDDYDEAVPAPMGLRDYACCYMPRSLRRALGLSHRSEKLLAHLNDAGVSFEVIAGTLKYLPIEDGDS